MNRTKDSGEGGGGRCMEMGRAVDSRSSKSISATLERIMSADSPVTICNPSFSRGVARGLEGKHLSLKSFSASKVLLMF